MSSSGLDKVEVTKRLNARVRYVNRTFILIRVKGMLPWHEQITSGS